MPQAVKGRGRALRLGWASWEGAAWEIAQLGSYYLGNCTVGKLLFEKLYSWEVTAWKIAQLGNYCLGNCTVGKLPFWKKSMGKYLTSFQPTVFQLCKYQIFKVKSIFLGNYSKGKN